MFLSPQPLAFLESIGGPEMFLIFVLSLILFGGKKLPEVARHVGKAVAEFKRAASGVENEIRRAIELESPNTIHKPRQPASPPRQYTEPLDDPSITPEPAPATVAALPPAPAQPPATIETPADEPSKRTDAAADATGA